MRCDPLAVAASSSFLLFLASSAGAVHVPAAFAFGPPGGGKCCGHVPSGRLPIGDHTAPCIGRHHRPIARGHVLLATSSVGNDDDDDDATDDIPGPRRVGRPKVSDEELEQRKEQLRELLCASDKEIDKLVHDTPTVLNRRDVVKNHGPKIAMLQERLGISQKAAGKLCLTARSLLASSLEILEANVDWLEEELKFTEEELSKVVKRRPGVLVAPENRMSEIQQWLKDRLGLGDARIARMSMNKPEILASKVTTLEDKVDRLQAAMSLSDEELGHLFGKYPNLFGYSPEKKIEPKLRFLRKRLGLDDQGLKEVILKCPSLLSRTEEDIDEKIKFYSGLVGESKAKRIVTKSSNLLKISLEKRLKPRLSEVQKAGIKVVWTEQLIQRLARRTDDVWERHGLEEARRGRYDS